MADSQSKSARTMVAGDVSVVAPARDQPQADAHVRRTRLRGQTRESGADGPDRRGQNGAGMRPSVEGFAERPPLPVRARAGSVRRDVRIAGGSIHASVTEPPGASG